VTALPSLSPSSEVAYWEVTASSPSSWAPLAKWILAGNRGAQFRFGQGCYVLVTPYGCQSRLYQSVTS